MLSQKLIELLRQYYKIYNPKKYLFEGSENEKYSQRSVQQIMKSSLKKSGYTPTVIFNAVFLNNSSMTIRIFIPIAHIDIVTCNGTGYRSSANRHIRKMFKI